MEIFLGQNLESCKKYLCHIKWEKGYVQVDEFVVGGKETSKPKRKRNELQGFTHDDSSA